MMLLQRLLAGLLVVVMTGCSPFQIATDYDPEADFTAYSRTLEVRIYKHSAYLSEPYPS